jgi:SAM-dependent methyltransferase
MADDALAAERWDAEYCSGRYVAEPPLAFVETILEVLRARGVSREATGLYVGCGNGRNYTALVDAGLTLYGLDFSAEALRQLAARRPRHAERLVHADFRDFQPGAALAYLIAIQVFQHGGLADVAGYFERTAALLRPGGLFFLRVNSASTQIIRRHAIVEAAEHGGFTLRYLEGAKDGMAIHFYSRSELDTLTRGRFDTVREPCEVVIHRAPPARGSWAQWEAVYARR